jgi:hypothetical protein
MRIFVDFFIIYNFIYVLLFEFKLSGSEVFDYPVLIMLHLYDTTKAGTWCPMLCRCLSYQESNEVSKSLNDWSLRKHVDTFIVEIFQMWGECLICT